jgi:hypothetical protein
MPTNTYVQKPYHEGLLLSNAFRKTCVALSEVLELSSDTVNRQLEKPIMSLEEFIRAAANLLSGKKKNLIIDDTLIPKKYSNYIEGTSDNYSSGEHRRQRSLNPVVALLSDGRIGIPITLKMWTSFEFDPENYHTRSALALKIVEEVRQHIEINVVILDGLFATKEMFEKVQCNVELRFHSNRVVIKNGQRYRVKDVPELQFKGKQTERSTIVEWHGHKLNITAIKRINKHGECTIIYLASNFSARPIQHRNIYESRWCIEKFFRTSKQHLGLNDCQARTLNKQINHILNVFVSYTIGVYEHLKQKTLNVEDALRLIKKRHSKRYSNYVLKRFNQIFRAS